MSGPGRGAGGEAVNFWISAAVVLMLSWVAFSAWVIFVLVAEVRTWWRERRLKTRIEMPNRTRKQLTAWYEDEILVKTPVFRGSIFGWIFGRFGQLAVTINKTIHLTPRGPLNLEREYAVALLGHEMYHVLQQHDMGWWRFLARYVWEWRPSHIKASWEHPMEAPAYAMQTLTKKVLEEAQSGRGGTAAPG